MIIRGVARSGLPEFRSEADDEFIVGAISFSAL